MVGIKLQYPRLTPRIGLRAEAEAEFKFEAGDGGGMPPRAGEVVRAWPMTVTARESGSTVLQHAWYSRWELGSSMTFEASAVIPKATRAPKKYGGGGAGGGGGGGGGGGDGGVR